MRCRKIERANGKLGMAFFGVIGTKGVDDKGYPVPIYTKDRESYADGSEGVVQSLEQRLTLIQGELCHFLNSGFPIVDKSVNKGVLDSYVISVVARHEDIKGIKSLSSEIINHSYKCKLVLETDYGDIEVEESQTI